MNGIPEENSVFKFITFAYWREKNNKMIDFSHFKKKDQNSFLRQFKVYPWNHLMINQHFYRKLNQFPNLTKLVLPIIDNFRFYFRNIYQFSACSIKKPFSFGRNSYNLFVNNIPKTVILSTNWQTVWKLILLVE